MIVFYGILCFSLAGLAHLIAALANAIYIKALSSRSKFFGHGNFCYYLFHSRVRQILYIATFQTNQVYMRFHIGIKSRLILRQTQFLN